MNVVFKPWTKIMLFRNRKVQRDKWIYNIVRLNLANLNNELFIRKTLQSIYPKAHFIYSINI